MYEMFACSFDSLSEDEILSVAVVRLSEVNMVIPYILFPGMHDISVLS